MITLRRTAMTTYFAGLDTEQARLLESKGRSDSERCTTVRYTDINYRARSHAVPGMDLGKAFWMQQAVLTRSWRTDLFRVRLDQQASMIAHGYALMMVHLVSVGVSPDTLGAAWRNWLSEQFQQ